jgi:hypothetical protein
VSNPVAPDRCFRTPESILVDGANGICRRPESHRPLAEATVIFSIVLAGAAFVAFARTRVQRVPATSAARVAMLAAIILLAVPGLIGVFVRRADAPAVRSAIAADVDRLVIRVAAFAHARGGCVDVVDEGCIACAPVIRFALPDPHECIHPRGHVVLHAQAMTRGCREQDDRLICGVAP